jgi:DNA-binding transcriptional MerR regulator
MTERSERAERDRRLDVAARLVRVSPARIRYYVRTGFVRPSRVEGDAPFFGDAELARLRRIRRLQEDLGLNAAGVEVALHLLDEIEQLQAALDRRSR